MTEVLEPMPLRTAGRQRQDRIQAIERLNGGLLIDGEHGRMLGRIHIQADHVGRFRSRSPDRPTACSARTDAAAARRGATLCDVVVMNLQQAPELRVSNACCRPAAPAASSRECAPPSPASAPSAAAVVPRPQPVQPLRQKSSTPAIDVVAVTRDRRFDRRVRCAVGQHQNHPRASRIFRPNLATASVVRVRFVHRLSTSAPYGAQRTSTDFSGTSH